MGLSRLAIDALIVKLFGIRFLMKKGKWSLQLQPQPLVEHSEGSL